MPGDLIITGTDSAAACLAKAGIGEMRLAWRDPLFEGPVTPEATLPALTAVRAEWLAAQPWGFRSLSAAELSERDRVLEGSGEYDRVWLWFGHNLSDQLQLLQLLHWFHANRRPEGTLILVEAEEWFGDLDPMSIAAFADDAREVTSGELELAAYAWDAFRQSTPETWAGLLAFDTSALPHLRATVLRMLEELPRPFSSLSRTEHQVLRGMRMKNPQPRSVYHFSSNNEQAAFREDWCCYAVLDNLARMPSPLFTGHSGIFFNPNMSLITWQTYVRRNLKLTLLGQALLDGREDLSKHNLLDRWWGGTNITSKRLWRWSPRDKRLLRPTEAAEESMRIKEKRELKRRPLKLAS